jgi:branched-chain amino acid transport system substrate-binding protein
MRNKNSLEFSLRVILHSCVTKCVLRPAFNITVVIFLGAWLLAAGMMAEARELVIANVAPFSGNGAAAGRDFNLGLMLCFDEINQTGGINGQLLRLVSRDDGSRDEETVRFVNEAISSEQALLLVGLSGASNIEAVLKSGVLQRNTVPVVGVRSGAVALRGEPLLFHLQPSVAKEAVKLIEQVKQLGLAKVAVFHQSDATGQDGLRSASEAAKQFGLDLVSSATFERFTLNVDPAVAQLLKAKPSVIIILADTNASAAFIKAYRKGGGTAQLIASSIAEPSLLVDQLGKDNSPGVGLSMVVPNPQRQNIKLTIDFGALLRKLEISPARANFASLSGYIAGRVAAEAVRQAGKNPTPAKVLRALEAMNRFNLGGYVVDFSNAEHEGVRSVELGIIGRSGQLMQ